MNSRKILVVNPNTNTDTTDLLVDVAESVSTESGFTVVGVTARSGPRMIVDADALTNAGKHTVSAALAGIAQHNPAAVIVGAFGDPGADELRALVDIPVIGIGRAAVLRAAAGGRRFAIATTTGELAEPISNLVRRARPDANFAGVFLSSSDPLSLAEDPDASVFELGVAVERAIAAGCEAVIIGGGPLSGSARQLARRTDVVIVEPVPSAVLTILDELRTASVQL